MDKRFVTFLMLTMLVMVGYLQLRLWLNPQPDRPPEVAQDDDAGDQDPADAGDPDGGADGGPAARDDSDDPDGDPAARAQLPDQWRSIGSVNPDGEFRMLLTFNSRGAALERAELSSPRYRDLEDDDGYLGHLALTDGEYGAIINVVGDGTPAANAKCTSGKRDGGLQAGDVIVQLNDTPLKSTPKRGFAAHFLELFHQTM